LAKIFVKKGRDLGGVGFEMKKRGPGKNRRRVRYMRGQRRRGDKTVKKMGFLIYNRKRGGGLVSGAENQRRWRSRRPK